MEDRDRRRLAESVRDACVAAALEAYEHAKLSGLCDEGAWEAAVGAMRMMNVDSTVATRRNDAPDGDDV